MSLKHTAESERTYCKRLCQCTSQQYTIWTRLDKNHKEHTTSTRRTQLAGLYLSDSTVIWYWARDTEVLWKWDARSVLHNTRRRVKRVADAAAWRTIMAKLKGSFGFIFFFLAWLARVAWVLWSYDWWFSCVKRCKQAITRSVISLKKKKKKKRQCPGNGQTHRKQSTKETKQKCIHSHAQK